MGRATAGPESCGQLASRGGPDRDGWHGLALGSTAAQAEPESAASSPRAEVRTATDGTVWFSGERRRTTAHLRGWPLVRREAVQSATGRTGWLSGGAAADDGEPSWAAPVRREAVQCATACTIWASAIAGRVSLVSVGAGNDYGHPA
ncbi:MAG TPA: hypothetical protein DHV14_03020, partial [Micrococcales bacterium]|nr:hypothetical protein [Micrococcales bacterium]